MDDKNYRLSVQKVFSTLEKAFAEVDPDIAEVELSAGACTIFTPKNKSKIIVSPQPPVKQVWVAVAALGVAEHYSWNAEKLEWRDDKDSSKELYAQLSHFMWETSQLKISFLT